MRRILCLLLTLLLVCGLCACGAKPGKNGPTPNSTAATTTTTTEGESTTTTATEGEETTTSATEGDGSTTATSHPTDKTTVTKKPTTATTTTGGGEDEGDAIRILAIGDGFAVDAMEKHLYDIFKSAGYNKVHLGILYADKSNLDTHHTNVKSDKAAYEFRQNTGGKWTKESKIAPSKAFKAAEWDYVVLQQAGADSGKPATFGKLKELTSLIKKQCGEATVYWHMTWAFQQSKATELMADYGYNQQMMYHSIINTTLQQVMVDPNVWALIPTGTTIQNLRTSSLKDTLTTDGKHLTDTYGDYAAALTWYCSLMGESADTVSYRPAAVKDHIDEIIEAVTNAMDIPNDITPAANGDGEFKSIKILAVGNSFAMDAMRNHLYEMLAASGYDEIRLGILHVGGCSIDQHYSYIKDNSASYQYQENTSGKWVNTDNYKAADAFAADDWDFVTVQQVSGYSGVSSSYGNLDALMKLIKQKSGDAKIYWQMTWAYQGDSNHGDFAKYGKDQMKMYNAIVSTVKEKIVGNPDFDGIIPTGTAVQNLRTSSLGDTLTADGYHLENAYGDYTASLTRYCTFTGESAYSMFYCPSSVGDHFHEIAEAVDNAVKKPYEVTESKY
ncbi:MAG: DUF4886 domain-containing protein [Clostridia bacterium]|nr:DUF4886 domain-containing protein [Clostridia bacterium]